MKEYKRVYGRGISGWYVGRGRESYCGSRQWDWLNRLACLRQKHKSQGYQPWLPRVKKQTFAVL